MPNNVCGTISDGGQVVVRLTGHLLQGSDLFAERV
jgi:hypothetical protein